jgi:hypothetical protein
MQLSQLLEQALVAWLRKWRPEYKLEVQGPEGPWRGRPIAVGDDDLETERPRANLKTLGLARKIHREQARSMEGFTANPAKKRGARRPKRKRGRSARANRSEWQQLPSSGVATARPQRASARVSAACAWPCAGGTG